MVSVLKIVSDQLPDDPINSYIHDLGMRVRTVRKTKGMSRKTLAEVSGISERYLAQLETGSGNISISLLLKVALALETPIEALVADGKSESAEFASLFQLYQRAGTAQRKKALTELGLGLLDSDKAKRVCLIGLRGAGKSTLGKILGDELDIPFMELNSQIEQISGIAVDEVMALYGQEGFRSLERQALERMVDDHDTMILAAAGGVVSEPATFEFMLRHFHTIWLKAEPEEHMERVRQQGDERPMAGSPKAMDALRSILTKREALYGQADLMVDTSGKSLDETRVDVIAAVKLIYG